MEYYLIFTLLLFFYLLINFLIIIYINKIFNSPQSLTSNPGISVIIAAKDEEKNIPGLIHSINKLDYPCDNFEVIFVDDESSDKTFDITKSLSAGINNFSLYHAGEKILPGKKGALSYGISKAKNPFIMITDADCRPEPGWLKSYAALFNKGYDFIFGIAPFIQNKKLVNKISCFENLRNWLLTLTAAGLKMPYSAAARNFGFKKSSFEKINGYSNTKETLSGDDDLLLREAAKNKLKTGIAAEKNSFVFSSAKENFREYFTQKSRHVKTSFHYLFKHKAVLGFWHLVNLILLIPLIAGFFNPEYFIFFTAKIIFDVSVVSSLQKKFNYRFKLIEAAYLQLFYEILLIINFFNAGFRKDKWK